MRKFLCVLMMSLQLFSFTACGSSEKGMGTSEQRSDEESTGISVTESGEESTETTAQEDVEKEEDISDAQQIAESKDREENQATNNILIVYFSRWGNTDYPDEVGGDVHLIETVTSYTADFDELRDVNHDEMAQNYLPELREGDLDIAGYDTVFVGYPVWATNVPQAVLSFLKEYDLSGKTVIPFCTHDGYGAGRSYQTIVDASHAVVSLDGIAIEAKDVPSAQDTVSDWLADIGITGAQEQDAARGETAIQITIGGITLDGVLYDTALAEEIKAYFPLTISMSGYGGREYREEITFSLMQ